MLGYDYRHSPASARRRPASAAPHVRLAGPAELAGLADRWNDLTADLGPIEQFDWADAARQTVALGQRPLVLSVEQDESLTALAALATQRRRGIVRLVQLGVGELFEPMDLVARDADSLDALAAALARLGRPLWLDRLPADSPAIPAIERAFRGRAVVLRRPAANCPYILLDESWQEPQDHLNAGRRSDLRRRGARPNSRAR